MRMASKAFTEKMGNLQRAENGTGPFKLEKYTANISYICKKHTDFFIPGRPYVDELDFIVVIDQATYEAAFRAGKVDVVVPNIQNKDTLLASVPKAQYVTHPLGSFSRLTLNVSKFVPFQGYTSTKGALPGSGSGRYH